MEGWYDQDGNYTVHRDQSTHATPTHPNAAVPTLAHLSSVKPSNPGAFGNKGHVVRWSLDHSCTIPDFCYFLTASRIVTSFYYYYYHYPLLYFVVVNTLISLVFPAAMAIASRASLDAAPLLEAEFEEKRTEGNDDLPSF